MSTLYSAVEELYSRVVGPTVVHECDSCGTTTEPPIGECEECGSTEIKTYVIE